MTWPLIQLNRLAEITGGSTPKRERDEYWGGGIPWLTPTDLPKPGDGIADVTDTASTITEDGLASCSARLLPIGTVLFSSRATIGKLGIAKAPVATNQGFANFIPGPAIDSKYLAYALLHRTNEIAGLAGSTTFKEVTKSALRKVKIAMPALSEQQRIVELLEQADALRQQRRAADEKAERVVFALFHSLFGNPATNSMGWPTEALDPEVVDFRYGTSERCEASYDGLPVLRIPNVVRGTLDLSDLKYADLPAGEAERLRLQQGDILFVRTNGNPHYVGRCSVFDLDDQFLFASYLIRGRFDRAKFLPEYVVTCLSIPAGRGMLARSIRTTAGQSNLSVKGLRELVLPRPPIELQQSFAKRRAALELLGAKQQSSTERTNRLFDVLLHRAFAGELTAGWRERHIAQLEAEMKEQVRLIDEASKKPKTRAAANGKPSGKRHAGHDMYNKAALTAYIVQQCHDAQRPMGRTKLAKLFYLVHRRAELSLTQEFARRAAGPLDDAIHKFLNLARKNKWVKLPRAQGPLKPVVPGDAASAGTDVARKLFADKLAGIDELLNLLRPKAWQELECWATVDAAANAIQAEGRKPTVKSIKDHLSTDPEWKPKLRRAAFSDSKIGVALNELRKLDFFSKRTISAN